MQQQPAPRKHLQALARLLLLPLGQQMQQQLLRQQLRLQLPLQMLCLTLQLLARQLQQQ
jgi:hypothetical protein